jgi:hypothetical protein
MASLRTDQHIMIMTCMRPAVLHIINAWHENEACVGVFACAMLTSATNMA